MIVMDSGLGGLSVVHALRRARPGLALTYVADTAGFPYGGRAAADISARAHAILRTLRVVQPPGTSTEAVIVACNTLSTLCLADLRAFFACPFVGTVPAVKVAGRDSRRFTLLATPNTAHSPYSLDLITQFAGGARVDRYGAPELAAIAERMLLGESENPAAIARELAPAFFDDARGRTDAVVLGCTHYPLIIDALRRAAPWEVRWINSGDAIARRALDLADSQEEAPINQTSTAFVTAGRDVARYLEVFSRHGFNRVAVLNLEASP